MFRYEKQVDQFVRDLLKSYDYPPNTTKLTDLYPDLSCSTASRLISLRSWMKSVEIHYDCLPEYEGAMRLMTMLISSHYSIGVYSSESGLGKTSLVKRLLTNIPHLRLVSTGERRSLLRRELFVDHQSILHHGKISRERKFLLWIEDLHLNDSELLRSWTDEDFTWIFTGCHPFSAYSRRFSRHFVPICLNDSLTNLIDSIYSIPIRDWLEEFPVDAINHPIELAHACLFTLEEIFEFLRRSFLKDQWNLHHVEAIVNGMFLLDGKIKRTALSNQLNLRYPKKKQQDEQTATIVRLLIHEISRTILDRLTDKRGQTLPKESFLTLFFCGFRSTCLSRISLENDRHELLQ